MSDADEARTAPESPETGERAVFTRLWTKLQAYDLDKPGDAIPFTAKLAAECGWSRDKARRVAFEYKRFVALALCSGHGACPSRAVDEAWHLHLIDTRRYWGEFCRDVLECEFHHEPGRGGIEEELRFGRLYRQTLADYRRFFGEEPPAEIWPEPSVPLPDPQARFGTGPILRKLRAMLGRSGKFFAVLGLVIALPGCAAIYDSSSPGALQGPAFLVLYIALVAGAVFASRALQDRVGGPFLKEVTGAALSPYHLAFLAGGPRRVFETAMTKLYVEGFVAIQANKAVLVRPVPSSAPAIERLIAEKLGDDSSPATPFAVGNAAEPIRRDLIKAGLVPGPEELARTRQIPFLIIGPLFLLGLIRFFYGAAHGRPVTFLIFCLIVTAVLVVSTARRQPDHTPAGRRAMRDAERTIQARGKPGADSSALPHWVALYSGGGLAGLGLTAFSFYLASTSTMAAKGGGGSSCGSGSSCGGGGSCSGGGCGG